MTEAQMEAAIKHMEGCDPKYHKGKYGKQFDYHTCGYCGFTVTVVYDYCPKCGTRILWTNPKCLTGIDEERSVFNEG